jgi:hypothetical protein
MPERNATPTPEMEAVRECAAAIRADAEKATPGRWKSWGMQALADQDGTSDVDTAVPVASTFSCDEAGRPRTYDLDHIIGMQPAVALAVADLLDLIATRHQQHDRSRIAPEVVCDGEGVKWPCDHMTKALALARAYSPAPSPPEEGS